MFNTHKFIIISLLLFTLIACKKEYYKDFSKLKLKTVRDFSDLDETPSSMKRANTTEYLMVVGTGHFSQNTLLLTDQSLFEKERIHNPYKIHDYIMLPDGSVLISQVYSGELANLAIISKDFATREQFGVGLPSAPRLHLADDGIIMISASGNVGVAVVAKYDFDFSELWREEFSGIRSHLSAYYPPTDQIYILDVCNHLYELDGSNGTIDNEFGLSTEPWDISREGNSLYVFGYENNGTYCGDDLEVLKLNLNGTEEWNVQLGRSGANDIIADLMVKDGLVYICGGYGEPNCLEGITSNHKDFYVAVLSDDGKVLGHRIENYEEDYTTGRGISLAPSLYSNSGAYLLGTKDVKEGKKNVSIYKVETKRFQ
ncbi:MAG: hypothetical protein P8I55_08680 [Crocinitomix sp.]|nr:hypothetical protein [Crocinitomix sp.]